MNFQTDTIAVQIQFTEDKMSTHSHCSHCRSIQRYAKQVSDTIRFITIPESMKEDLLRRLEHRMADHPQYSNSLNCTA